MNPETTFQPPVSSLAGFPRWGVRIYCTYTYPFYEEAFCGLRDTPPIPRPNNSTICIYFQPCRLPHDTRNRDSRLEKSLNLNVDPREQMGFIGNPTPYPTSPTRSL